MEDRFTARKLTQNVVKRGIGEQSWFHVTVHFVIINFCAFVIERGAAQIKLVPNLYE